MQPPTNIQPPPSPHMLMRSARGSHQDPPPRSCRVRCPLPLPAAPPAPGPGAFLDLPHVGELGQGVGVLVPPGVEGEDVLLEHPWKKSPTRARPFFMMA